MAQPNAAYPGGRDQHPALGQIVGRSHLSVGGLLHSQLHDCFLDVLFDSVLHTGFAATDFLQRQFATFVIKLLETIEAIP